MVGGYLPARPGRFRRHVACSLSSCGRLRDPPARRRCWPPARDRRRESCRVGPRLPSEAVGHTERLWPARLRWRLRGAWLWPAFFAADAARRHPAHALPPYGACRPAGRRRAARGVREPAPGRRRSRRSPGGGCAAAGPTCRGRSPADYAGAGAGRRARRGRSLVAGVLHRPAVARRATTTGAMLDAVAATSRAQAPALARRARRGRRARARAPDVYRACVPGPRPAPLAVPVRRHRPAARRGVPRDDRRGSPTSVYAPPGFG